MFNIIITIRLNTLHLRPVQAVDSSRQYRRTFHAWQAICSLALTRLLQDIVIPALLPSCKSAADWHSRHFLFWEYGWNFRVQLPSKEHTRYFHHLLSSSKILSLGRFSYTLRLDDPIRDVSAKTPSATHGPPKALALRESEHFLSDHRHQSTCRFGFKEGNQKHHFTISLIKRNKNRPFPRFFVNIQTLDNIFLTLTIFLALCFLELSVCAMGVVWKRSFYSSAAASVVDTTSGHTVFCFHVKLFFLLMYEGSAPASSLFLNRSFSRGIHCNMYGYGHILEYPPSISMAFFIFFLVPMWRGTCTMERRGVTPKVHLS